VETPAQASFRTSCKCLVAEISRRTRVDDEDDDGDVIDIGNGSKLPGIKYVLLPSADTQLLATSIKLLKQAR
jgi:hypothetical protein